MRQILYWILVLLFGIFLQLTIFDRIMLVNGSGDLVLVLLASWALQEKVHNSWIWGVVGGLLIGGISANPWYIYLISYLAITGMARLLIKQIWQAPLLAMFAVTFVGSLLLGILTYLYRFLFESLQIPLGDVFLKIILPSILFNLLLAIIVYPLMRYIAGRIYPAEVIE
jgi:rod shape-determining protein MreD